LTELYNYADTVEPYIGEHQPSALLVCVYRLFTINVTSENLRTLLTSSGNPHVRCAGVLIVRYGLHPEQLWPWLGEYLLDDEEFPADKAYFFGKTFGSYIEYLMLQDQYYNTVLPRLPVPTKRYLEPKLAQVPQYRKRAWANHEVLDYFREKGTKVEACPNDPDEWRCGEVVALLENRLSQLRVRIRFDTNEQDVPLGKVIIADPNAKVSHLSRGKGRSTAELVEEYKNRQRSNAVCSSGKDYAKRPVGFLVASKLDIGSASYNLVQEDTAVKSKARRERSRSRSPQDARRKEPSLEHRMRMEAVFKKYGQQKAGGGGGSSLADDTGGPDVMRLG